MALISDAYREQNRLMHERVSEYGSKGYKNAPEVKRLAELYGAKTVLDYGCGKKGLEKGLQGSGLTVINYDPAVPEHAADPPQADLIVCADVLEHIEPELLDDVLAHLKSKMLKAGLLVVSCRPATAFLPNGKNTHQIVKEPTWWLEKIGQTFHVEHSKSRPVHAEVILWVEA